MKTAVCSLKFSPGMYSHVLALGTLLSELGHDVELILDEGYRALAAEGCPLTIQYASKGRPNRKAFADVLVAYNLSLYDLRLQSLLSADKRLAKLVLVYHEPYRGISETLHGLLSGERNADHTLRIIARHLISRMTLRKCSQIWLPSDSALREYSSYDVRYNGAYAVLPLFFLDESSPTYETHSDHKYFSYISHAIPAKGFAEYLRAVKAISLQDASATFQIVTATSLGEDFLDNELRILQETGRLIVKQGRTLTNEEINEAYASSNCTWFGYNVSTQSGVLAKSFMFGSPGIATRIGSFPEEINGRNGILINDNTDEKEIVSAYQRIQDNFDAFSQSARESFLTKHYYRCYLDRVDTLIAELKDRE